MSEIKMFSVLNMVWTEGKYTDETWNECKLKFLGWPIKENKKKAELTNYVIEKKKREKIKQRKEIKEQKR